MAGDRGRRKAVFAVIVLLLLFTINLACSEECRVSRYAVTGGADVWLLSAPDNDAQRICPIPEGYWINVLEDSSQAWLHVRTGKGETGWVAAGEVLLPEWSMTAVGLVSTPQTDGYLNLRDEPSYSARVNGIYYSSTPCLLLGHLDGWYEVTVDGRSGWFREEFVNPVQTAWSESLYTIVLPDDSPLSTVWLLSTPGDDSERVLEIAAGRYAMMIQAGAEWSLVSADGQIGFLPTSCLIPGLKGPASSNEKEKQSGSGHQIGFAEIANVTATQVVNLRRSPEPDSPAVAQFGLGTRLTVLKQGLSWCKVISEQGQAGFIRTDYLRIFGLPEIPVMHIRQAQHSYANLRSTADQDSSGNILAQIPDGETVTVLTPGDRWVEVEWQGLTGFVAVYLLR